MNLNKFPQTIDYQYNALKQGNNGELSAIFKATDELEIPQGFAHLDTYEVQAEDLDALPENFNGVESAKKAIEHASQPG